MPYSCLVVMNGSNAASDRCAKAWMCASGRENLGRENSTASGLLLCKGYCGMTLGEGIF